MSFTAATVHLPDGNDIYYLDSGPVAGSSTYTTIVMLHGSGFNAYVFEPLLPLAPQYNLRLIVVQRRDYRGSSPYTEAELQDLRNGDPVFLERHTVLLSHLLEYFIKTLSLPESKTEETVREGGVALLGWSIGCATVNTLLSDSRLFNQEQYLLLRRYLIKIVLYDPPFSVFGYDSAEGPGATYPLLGKTPEEHYENFKIFVSSYFDTPSDWNGDPKELDARSRDRPTVNPASKEKWDKIYQADTAARSEYHVVRGPIQKAFQDLRQRALFDEDRVKTTFPDVPILTFVCWKSIKNTLWGYHCLRATYQEQKDQGKFVRPLSFEIIGKANHFWHWDYPNEFLETIANRVRG